MSIRGPGDRLAVRTHTENGEQYAFGEPGVTDQERAAAGWETLAQRTQLLLAKNRGQARRRYERGPSADDDDATRVWFPRAPQALRSRLGQERLAVWSEADVLHVLWRGHADHVQLVGGVQPTLWRVPDTDDLWEASLRIRRLDHAVISVIVLAEQSDDRLLGAPATATELWRGPSAPARPTAPTPLIGTIEEHLLDSAHLGGAREVTVYRPPGQGPLPACVVADGQSVRSFADAFEAAVLAETAPAVLLVGVHSALDPGRAGIDGRNREYLPSPDRRRFTGHLRFVTDTLTPWAADRYPLRPGPWLAAGFSSGAAWAIAAAQRRPDVFGAVAALSPGIVPTRISAAARRAGVRHYLAGGILEPGFRRSTHEWADRLHHADLPYRHHEWIGGHDPWWWQQQLPTALDWLLTR